MFVDTFADKIARREFSFVFCLSTESLTVCHFNQAPVLHPGQHTVHHLTRSAGQPKPAPSLLLPCCA